MKYAVAFGRFWWDFVVGDSVALAIGGVGVIGLTWALADLDWAKSAEIIAPALIVGTLWVSLVRR